MARHPLALAALGGASLLIATPVAAAVEDTQAWTAVHATADVGARGVFTLEAQLRMTDDASRAGQVLLRPSIGLRVTDTTTLSVGYAYVRTEPVGRTGTDEHRAWQQVAFRLAGDGQGVTLTGRSRLEQRWVAGAPDMGWRARQQLRVSAPLGGGTRAVAWTEGFYSFNDTTWGQDDGLNRVRNFVGFTVPVKSTVSLEPGYLNQWIGRQARDRVEHIASISIAARM